LRAVVACKDRPQPCEHTGRGAQILSVDIRKSLLPTSLPTFALGFDLTATAIGEMGDDDAPVGLLASTLDVAARGEVIKHLRDGRRGELRSGGELASGERAALVELQQQLELRVAEFGPGEMRIASTQPTEAAKQRAKGETELIELLEPLLVGSRGLARERRH